MENQRSPSLTVSQLNHRVKQALESNFGNVWVEGEISDIARPKSGHIYLTLKDKQSQVRGIVWNRTAAELPFELRDGQTVLCNGSVDVYPARGSYQLIIRRVELQGIGGLQLALRQLQQKLGAEGLFDPARKKPLPRYPNRIGLLTSATGAAVRDFLAVTCKRWPGIEILVIPSNVQGAEAAEDIIVALLAAHQIDPPLDALVVGRGGGSLEDLWCFNDERVVRAIAASEIPTISAIGHEIDVTLTDLVSDRRALTPTEAGQFVVQSKSDVADELKNLSQQMRREISRAASDRRRELELQADRPVFTQPYELMKQNALWLNEVDVRIRKVAEDIIMKHRQHVGSASAVLDAVGPMKVLSRGYTVARTLDDHQVIRSAVDLQMGDRFELLFEDGVIHAETITQAK